MAESVVNWNAIYISVAAAGAQCGTALYNLWKRYKRPRRIETGYEKVQRGETIDGWKMVISPDRIRNKDNRSVIELIMPPWRNEGTELHSMFRHDLSLLVQFLHDAPDGRAIYELRRCSVIANVDKTIARIVCNPQQWLYQGTSYLNSRVTATIFREVGTSIYRYRLILVDTRSNRSQTFTIQSTYSNIHAIRAFSKHQLSVLYFAREDIEWKFCDAIYEIPSGINVRPAVNALSCEELSIPAEPFIYIWCGRSGFPPIAVISTRDDFEYRKVVSFDPGNWRMKWWNEWRTSFRNTPIGSRYMNAMHSFYSLSPAGLPDVNKLPPFAYNELGSYEHVRGSENSSAVYATKPKEGGIMRRWINRPTLKHLAAEAFCQANPNADLYRLKNEIGFDVLDGILDDDEGTAPIIHLSD